MAILHEKSFSQIGLCINRNNNLLYLLLLEEEPVRLSQIIEDERFKNTSVNELIEYNIVNILGKDIVCLTPEFRKFVAPAFNIKRNISDYDVIIYIDNLKNHISDYIATKDFVNEMLLYKIKGDISDIINEMNSSVDGLYEAVEHNFKSMKDDKLKIEEFKRYAALIKRLRNLRNEVDKIFNSVNFQDILRNANDGQLSWFVNECLSTFSQKGTDLLKILNTIKKYLIVLQENVEFIERIHKIKALQDEGKLLMEKYSNLREILQKDACLWHENRKRPSLHISLKELRERDDLGDIIKRIDLKNKEKMFKSEAIGPAGDFYDEEERVDRKMKLEKIKNQFLPTGKDLFSFIDEYDFGRPLTFKQKIDVFVKISAIYSEEMLFTNTYIRFGDKMILRILPK